MTAKEMLPAIGSRVYLRDARGFGFLVLVTDVKYAWGKPRLEVQPVAGTGRAWIDVDSVRPATQEVAQ